MTNHFDFRLRTIASLRVVGAVVFLALLAGCATTNGLNRNKQAAKELTLLFRIYDRIESDPFFPETLHDVAQLLKEMGVADALPQCKCADGKMRDFIYVAGFGLTDAGGWAYLFSPPEMDSKKVIVISLDSTIKVMSREDANKEMEKSRAFTRQRNRVAWTNPSLRGVSLESAFAKE